MALQFQPYRDPGIETRDRWSHSFESIMQAYQLAKQQEQARQVQDVQMRSQHFGANPLNLTEDQRRQAYGGPAMSPAVPESVDINTARYTPAQPPQPMYSQNPDMAGIERSQYLKQHAMDLANLKTKGEINHLNGSTSQENIPLDQAAFMMSPSGDTEAQAKAKQSLLSLGFTTTVPRHIVDVASQNARTDFTTSSREEERAMKRQDLRNQEHMKIVDKFNSDPSVVKAQQALDGAANVKALADSKNPIAAAAIPTFMARASGEVGNLSEADKRPFGGSQDIINRLNAAVTQSANGQLTPENAEFVKNLADVMSKRANENLDRTAKLRSKQYGSGNKFTTPEDIFMSLRPDSTYSDGGGSNDMTGTTKSGKPYKIIKE